MTLSSFPVARVSGLQQNVWLAKESHIRTTLTSRDLSDMTKLRLLKSLQSVYSCQSGGCGEGSVGGWVGSNTVPVCITVCTGVGKRLHTPPSHPTLSKPQCFNSGKLTNKLYETYYFYRLAETKKRKMFKKKFEIEICSASLQIWPLPLLCIHVASLLKMKFWLD